MPELATTPGPKEENQKRDNIGGLKQFCYALFSNIVGIFITAFLIFLFRGIILVTEQAVDLPFLKLLTKLFPLREYIYRVLVSLLFTTVFASSIVFIYTWIITRSSANRTAEIATQQKAELNSGLKSEEQKTNPNIWFVMVHGIGIQDRFQTLAETDEGFRTVLGREKSKFTVKDGDSREYGGDYRSFKLENKFTYASSEVRIYEAYWGSKFSGQTTFLSTAKFLLGSVPMFFRTLLTDSKKRALELLLGGVPIAVFAYLVLFSALALEATEKVHKETTTVIESIETNKSDVRRTTSELSLDSAEKKWLRKNGYSTLLERLSQDKTRTLWDRSFIVRSLILPTLERTNSFLVVYGLPPRSELVSLGDLVKRVSETLLGLPLGRQAFLLIYFGVYVMTIKGILRFLTIWVTWIRSWFENGKPSDPTALKSAIWPGAGYGTILSAVDHFAPVVDLLLFVPFLVVYGIGACVRFWLTEFFGDVEIYANLNENAKHFPAREAAITVVENEIRKVLQEAKAVGNVKVVVVGHSLGSCVALQALRRMQMKKDERYPTHFFTLGSPLRKYRQLYAPEPSKQGLRDYYGPLDAKLFKPTSSENNPEIAKATSSEKKSQIDWTNFYYDNDVVADPLAPVRSVSASGAKANDDFHCQDVKLPLRWRLWVHSDYHVDPKCVYQIFDKVLH